VFERGGDLPLLDQDAHHLVVRLDHHLERLLPRRFPARHDRAHFFDDGHRALHVRARVGEAARAAQRAAVGEV
jgi:hypothetical protein